MIERLGRLAAAAAIFGTIGLVTAPQPAHALGTGAAIGIGLGAFALGTALATPSYGYPGYSYPGYGYPGYAAPPPVAYYPPSAPASCWSPYYNSYVAC